MIIDFNSLVWWDDKWLKNINLINNKWYAINKLVIILKDFAEITEYLSESNYITISLMYSLLVKI